MMASSFIRRFAADRDGGGAAEFALILPLFILFFVGIMDGGRFLYAVNQGEKATQIGARWAVVTDPLAPALSGSYVGASTGSGTLAQGDRIPASALGVVECNKDGCRCASGLCPSDITSARVAYADAGNFTNLLNRVRQIMPDAQASNLLVEYRGSGLGYAGNPDGMDISPLVTVRLTGMSFSPFILFGADVGFSSSYTLTMEDGQGSESN